MRSRWRSSRLSWSLPGNVLPAAPFTPLCVPHGCCCCVVAVLWLPVPTCVHPQIQLEAFWSARWAAFPCVYYVYYVYWGIESMSIVNLMSLFVLCGIGTDDVFILTDVFVQLPRRHKTRTGKDVRPYAERVDRLVVAYQRAGSAMFVTSLTTAASFFSNIVSDIKAIRNFGLWMGSLVVVRQSSAI